MKEKKLYMIAIVGAIICFIGDNLLGDRPINCVNLCNGVE